MKPKHLHSTLFVFALAISTALAWGSPSPASTIESSSARSPGHDGARASGHQKAQQAVEGPTFEGLWNTSFGPMRLSIDGAGNSPSGARAVTGTYAFAGGSRIQGTLNGDSMEFAYEEPQGKNSGRGNFKLAEDGASFRGRWQAAAGGQFREWKGTRIEPVPGRTWLVILEAHWETGLAEEQYAFGDMLRSYFKMPAGRHIAVRQRMFHGIDDFRRFTAELTYLAEPVVLLISTHGTSAGILVGGATIGPDIIAECLRDAPNLKLLHLSGCSMMNGPLPRRILKGIEAARRFPITGYSTVVAWDASALADFTFLTFLLIRKLTAKEAVRQTHLSAPYTAHTAIEGSVFIPLGLGVLLPTDL